MEEGIRKLTLEEKHKIQSEVSHVLKHAKPPATNIEKNTLNALKNLKKDKDRIVVQADKGKCVVLMDTDDYNKASDLLDNRNTYSQLKNDPTKTTERKLNKILLELKKSEKISESLYKRLHSSDGLPPRFYGLPKIHKPQIPLRPIISFVDSPKYNLSSYLANILVGNKLSSEILTNLQTLLEIHACNNPSPTLPIYLSRIQVTMIIFQTSQKDKSS